jgi:hypothetical protein
MLGTILSVQEKVMPGFKATKDHCILLLGGNTSGSYKIRPLVYQSENTQAHMDYGEGILSGVWRSKKKSWITAG